MERSALFFTSATTSHQPSFLRPGKRAARTRPMSVMSSSTSRSSVTVSDTGSPATTPSASSTAYCNSTFGKSLHHSATSAISAGPRARILSRTSSSRSRTSKAVSSVAPAAAARASVSPSTCGIWRSDASSCQRPWTTIWQSSMAWSAGASQPLLETTSTNAWRSVMEAATAPSRSARSSAERGTREKWDCSSRFALAWGAARPPLGSLCFAWSASFSRTPVSWCRAAKSPNSAAFETTSNNAGIFDFLATDDAKSSTVVYLTQ
mmetsp:Transcript_22448/g.74410  ORF Transcript_22448/g.74410 Transcript_22448/m.74410 type:complete len:264 (+) Transcript_22448:189-980(+)